MKGKTGFQNRLSAPFTHPSTNTSFICLAKYKKNMFFMAWCLFCSSAVRTYYILMPYK